MAVATTLATRAVRDAAGLQTLEQAFLATAMQLRAGSTVAVCTINLLGAGSVQGFAVPVVQVKANCLYSQAAVLKGGIDYFANLAQSTKLTNFYPLTKPVPAIASNPLPLPAEPANLKTVEAYLLWLSQMLQLGAAQTPSVPSNFISVVDDGKSTIAIVCNLPYQTLTYLKTNNLIASLYQVVTVLPDGVLHEGSNQQIAPMDNVTLMNNTTLMGN
ncbi:MAG: hypothetical protein NVS2B14_00370 [Chamaesiphon sp.]